MVQNIYFLPAVMGVVLLAVVAFQLFHLTRAYRRLKKQSSSGPPLSYSAFLKLSFLGGWADYLEVYSHLREKEYHLQLSLNKARFQNLQSQINPHFLYNSLETIRGLALADGARRAADMAAALGKYFRYNISFKVDVVNIGDEIANIRNYFFIQKYRFGDRFAMVMDFDETDENIMRYPLPKMTIQPLVENAIFHGLEKKISGGRIVIRIRIYDKDLSIHVVDNGAGIKPEQLHRMNALLCGDGEAALPELDERSNGVGLLNINHRLRVLYGPRYGLHIESLENEGTDVEITMPYPPAHEELKEA